MKWSEAYEHSGWTIVLPVKLIHAIGAKGAILVAQIFYWSGKQLSEDGWIYKTQVDLEKETGLSRHEQNKCVEDLKKKKVLETRYERLDHRLYYRINRDTLDDIMEADSPSEIRKTDFGKSEKRISGNPESGVRQIRKAAFGNIEQEITSENTTTTTENRDADVVVVASLANEFNLNQIQKEKISKYLTERGRGYVQEKASLTRSEKRENAGRYFMGALRDDFQPPKPAPKPRQAGGTIRRSDIDWDWKAFLIAKGMVPYLVPKSLADMSDRMFKNYIAPEQRKRLESLGDQCGTQSSLKGF